MCSIAFAALAHLTRGTQIPIAERAARCGPADEHKSRFPPLEVFVRRPPKFAARSDAAGIRKPSQTTTSPRSPLCLLPPAADISFIGLMCENCHGTKPLAR